MKLFKSLSPKTTTWRESLVLASGQCVPVEFVTNPRAKRFVLRLDKKSGHPRVAIPPGGSPQRALDFARKNIGWIAEQQGLRQAKTAGAMTLEAGGKMPWNGAEVTLIHGDHSQVRLVKDALEIPKSRDVARAALDYLAKSARTDMAPRVQRYVDALPRFRTGRFAVSKLRITDTKSRWGSCSGRGVISLSKRLMMAPPWIRDYVCAHEVAHLAQPDHSPAFWALCVQLEPAVDPKVARAYLKEHGPRYFAVQAP